MAVIEFLYPSVGNLYGEIGSTVYLRARLPECLFVSDKMGEEPYFVSSTPDMIVMGSMTENAQKSCAEQLTPYKERLFELIEQGCVVIATGNAWEIFTRSILFKGSGDDADELFPCLGLLPFETVTDYFARNHGKVLGEFEGMKIVGYHARFSQVNGDAETMPFVRVTKGEGMNKSCAVDGVRYKNFFGTHLLGPLMVCNPEFTEYLLDLAGIDEPKPQPLFDTALEAYRRRLEEFEKPGMKY